MSEEVVELDNPLDLKREMVCLKCGRVVKTEDDYICKCGVKLVFYVKQWRVKNK